MRKLALVNRLMVLVMLLTTFQVAGVAQTTNQWNYVGCPGMAYASVYNKMIMDNNGQPYIVNRYSKAVSIYKFDGYSWSQVGATIFDSTYINSVAIALDNNNTPYVAFNYYVGNSSYNVIVKKFDGNNWVNIKQFTGGRILYINLKADDFNNLYLAYRETGTGVIVEKHTQNTNNWSIVGSAPVVTMDAVFLSLDIDNNNNPAIAFHDITKSGKVSVYGYNGTTWNSIGNPGISNGKASAINLAFNKSNEPYVAYREYIPFTPGYNLSVMKYTGTNWTAVGNYVNTPGSTPTYTSFTIDSNDVPVVGYTESVSGIGTTAFVSKYDGNNWKKLMSAGDIQYGFYMSLAVDPNNRIYLSCYDRNVTTIDKYSVWVYDSTANYPKIRPAGSTTVCNGGSVVLSIQSCGNNDTLQWYVNGNAISGATSDVYIATTSGHYTVGITSGGNTTYTDPLTVNVLSPSVTVSSVLVNNTYTGGNGSTIYLGYGPQSATFIANATGATGFTYSWSPATALSCTNCQSPVFVPTTAGNYTYTVTATSAEGCSTTTTVSFCVLDVRDIKNNNTKIYVCHNGKSKSISANTVATHLQHGDALGECEQSCNSAAKGGKKNTGNVNEENGLEHILTTNSINIYPNPTTGTFMIEVPDNLKEGVIVIRDIAGQEVNRINYSSHTKLTLNNVADGLYIIELHSNNNVYREKLQIRR